MRNFYKAAVIFLLALMPFNTLLSQTMYLSTSGSYYSYSPMFNAWLNKYGGQILRLDLSTCTSTVVLPFSTNDPTPAYKDGPSTPAFYDIAISSANPNIIYGISNNCIYKVDITVPSYTKIDSAYNGLYGAGHVLNAMVCDNAGNIYMADGTGSDIYKYNIAGKAWSVIGTATGYNSGGDLTFYNKKLYLTTTNNQLVSMTLSPFSFQLESTLNNGSSQIKNMFGVVSFSTGTICFSNSQMVGSADSTVYIVDPATGICTPKCSIHYNQVIFGAATIYESVDPPKVIVTPTASASTICNGFSTTLSATGNAVSYSWNPGGAGTSVSVSPSTAATYTVTGTDGNGCTATSTIGISVNNGPTLGSSQSNPTCSTGNGSATVSATTGSANYTYSWGTGTTSTSATASNTISNLSAGNYSVVVSDATGCTTTKTFVLATTPAVGGTASATPATCGSNNGTATAAPSGGNSVYTYSWNNSGTSQTISGLAVGGYTVTIKDGNNCTSTAVTSISNLGAATVNASVASNVSCFGTSTGSATATVSGGTSPLTYSWSNGITGSTSVSGLAQGTYNFSVTDANNCTAVSSVTITQPGALTSTASPSASVKCKNGSDGTAGVSASGGISGYTYSWNTTPSQSAATASGLAAGNYTVEVSDTKGCKSTAVTTITEPTALDLGNTTSTNVSCFNGNNGTGITTPSGGTPNYSYSWNTTPAQTTANASGLTAATYSVKVTDGNGCTSSSSVTITQPTIVTAGATNVPATCGSNNGSASSTAGGGAGSYSYSWNNGSSTQNISGLAVGNYTVTVKDGNNCTAAATTSISNLGAATVNASVSSNASCFGTSTGSATATVSGGTSPFTYSWSNGSTGSVSASGLAHGTYTFTVTDANNCVTLSSVTVTEPALLTSSASQATSVKCKSGTDGTGSVSASGGTSGYSYSWNTTPSQTSSTATGLAAGSYTVEVTDTKGCKSTSTTTITEPTAVNLSNNSQVNVSCFSGNNGTATVTPSGGTTGYAYSWNTSPVQTSATASGLSAGAYTLTVTDANNCSQTVSMLITQPSASLASTASQSTSVSCNGGNNGVANVTVSGGTSGYTYSWNSSPSQTASTASGLTAGIYTVEVTDTKGCKSTASTTITQPIPLNLDNSTQSNVLCYGGNSGSAQAVAIGGTSGYNYSWNTTPSQSTAIATALTSGNYVVKITDSKGCTATKAFTVSQPSAPLVSSIGSVVNLTCNNATGSATATGSAGTSPYSYTWSTSPAQTTANATGLSSTTYIVNVKDANGCTTSTSVTLTQPAPLVATSANGSTICQGTAAVVNGGANNGNGPYTYSWSNGIGTGAGPHNVYPSGTITYTVTATDACGTTATATVVVNVHPKPRAYFSLTPENANTGENITFKDSSKNAVSWDWNFGDESGSNDRNPIHAYALSGNFPVTLIVTSVDGCKDTAYYHDVKIKKIINIPNIFTPTGDGINDLFVITTSGVKEYFIEIYDRWGLLMFKSTDAQIHWDGHAPSGGNAPEGTYYYIVGGKFTDNEVFQKQGYLTLMR